MKYHDEGNKNVFTTRIIYILSGKDVYELEWW
jgi:hypothetical protein